MFNISLAFAADIRGLTQLFKENFYEKYNPRYCGDNITNLIKDAVERKIDISNSFVMSFDELGSVNANLARERGNYIKPIPTAAPFHHPGTQMWFHHVILIASENDPVTNDKNYFVFDLDFTNEPTVVTVETYLDQMFVPKSVIGDLNLRKNHIKNFKADLFESEKFVQSKLETDKIISAQLYQEAKVGVRKKFLELFPDYYTTVSNSCSLFIKP